MLLSGEGRPGEGVARFNKQVSLTRAVMPEQSKIDLCARPLGLKVLQLQQVVDRLSPISQTRKLRHRDLRSHTL